MLRKEYPSAQIPPKISLLDIVEAEAARDPQGFGRDLRKFMQDTPEARVGNNAKALVKSVGNSSTSTVVATLSAGLPVQKAASMLGVSPTTVQNSRTKYLQSKVDPNARTLLQTQNRMPNRSKRASNGMHPLEVQAFLDWLWQTHSSKSGDRKQIAWYKGTK